MNPKKEFHTEDEEGHTSRVFSTGAERSADCEDLRYSLIPPQALRALAKRYGLGAKKYNDYNWVKGIPFTVVLDHLLEHVAKFMQGSPGEDDDIQNMAAIMWACAAIIYYLETGRHELDDRGYDRAIKKETFETGPM